MILKKFLNSIKIIFTGKQTRYSKIIKRISLGVLLVFFVSTLRDFSYAREINVIREISVKSINGINFKFESIIENFIGNSLGGEKIVLFQNLYCHPVVQENIKNIITDLKREYDKRLNVVVLKGLQKKI